MEPVNMDKYLEIAIEVGAEDVILIEDPTVDNDSMKKVLKVTNLISFKAPLKSNRKLMQYPNVVVKVCICWATICSL